MSSPALETFLARLYSDAELRERFLAAPANVAAAFGLTPAEVAALEKIDHAGLQLAAKSYAKKRQLRHKPGTLAQKFKKFIKRVAIRP